MGASAVTARTARTAAAAGAGAEVVRGGDGGVAPRAAGVANARRILAGRDLERLPKRSRVRVVWLSSLVATADPHDRAHAVRSASGLLVPAGVGGRPTPGLLARPRLYPRCYMTGAGVSVESVYDDTEARRHRLDGVAGLGPARAGEQASAVEQAIRRFGVERVRRACERTGPDPGEDRALRAMADAILRRGAGSTERNQPAHL